MNEYSPASNKMHFIGSPDCFPEQFFLLHHQIFHHMQYLSYDWCSLFTKVASLIRQSASYNKHQARTFQIETEIANCVFFYAIHLIILQDVVQQKLILFCISIQAFETLYSAMIRLLFLVSLLAISYTPFILIQFSY